MWISKGEYRRLLRQLARSERRAESDRASLDIERHENNRMLRHMTNMFLRARQIGAYPLTAEPAKETDTPSVQHSSAFQSVDDGELDALLSVAPPDMTRKEVENFLRGEKGLPLI